MLSHEASIIATKERAEMKMIEFFIARKSSLTALGIQSHSAVRRKACSYDARQTKAVSWAVSGFPTSFVTQL